MRDGIQTLVNLADQFELEGDLDVSCLLIFMISMLIQHDTDLASKESVQALLTTFLAKPNLDHNH